MWKLYNRCNACKNMIKVKNENDESPHECPKCGKWYSFKRVEAKKTHIGKWYNPFSWFKYKWMIKKNPESN